MHQGAAKNCLRTRDLSPSLSYGPVHTAVHDTSSSDLVLAVARGTGGLPRLRGVHGWLWPHRRGRSGVRAGFGCARHHRLHAARSIAVGCVQRWLLRGLEGAETAVPWAEAGWALGSHE